MGSLGDYLDLEYALAAYRTAEANAKSFDNTSLAGAFAAQERLRQLELTSAAFQCGYQYTNPLGPIAWAEKRVGTFQQAYRRA